jgi:hypothetical protein
MHYGVHGTARRCNSAGARKIFVAVHTFRIEYVGFSQKAPIMVVCSYAY